MPRSKKAAFGRIFRRAGRPGYYIRLRAGGRETVSWAGPDKKTAAEFSGRLLHVKAREDLLGEKPVADVSFNEIQGDLLAHLRSRHGARTFAVEEQRLGVIVKYFDNVVLSKVNTGAVTGFLTWLRVEKKLSVATCNRYTALLSVAFRWAVDARYAHHNPVAGLPRGKEDTKAVLFLTGDDIARLVAAASDPEYRVLLRLLADTGLRRSEALALAWRDVNLARGFLTVRRSKTHKPREIPMTVAVREALADHQSTAKVVSLTGTTLVFPAMAKLDPSSVSARLAAVVTRAGLPEMRLHDLRHAFCSRLAQRGVPLPTVAALAGHRAIQTTMRYASHLPNGAIEAAVASLDAPDRKADPAPAGVPYGVPTKTRSRKTS